MAFRLLRKEALLTLVPLTPASASFARAPADHGAGGGRAGAGRVQVRELDEAERQRLPTALMPWPSAGP